MGACACYSTSCGGLRATFRSLFFPSIIWILGIELRLSGFIVIGFLYHDNRFLHQCSKLDQAELKN